MNLEDLKNKLKSFKKENITFTKHAEIQAYIREVDLNEVKNNIVNPDKLVYFREDNEKFDCYFAYSKQLYHRYILNINHNIIIVTIIKINRDWQKAVEGK